MSAKLVTNQGDRLKAVFESIRDYVSECRIIFREQGMEFVGQDSAKVVVFRYVIVAKSIRAVGGSYFFNSPRPIEVSAKTRAIAAHLRCSSPRDVISFEIDPAIPDKLIFNVQNSDKNSRADITLPTPDGPVIDVLEFNSLKWYGAVTMSSSLFHDMIRDLSSADPNPPLVALYCDGYTFTLTADGLMSRVTFTVSDKHQQQTMAMPAPAAAGTAIAPVTSTDKKKKGKDPVEEEDVEKTVATEQEQAANSGVVFKRTDASQWPVAATYPISFMQRVAKAKNVCGKITILLRADYPVAFVYDSQIGVLTYIISPRVEEDIGDPTPPPGLNKRPTAGMMAYNLRQKKRRIIAANGAPVQVEEDDGKVVVHDPIVKREDEDEIAENLQYGAVVATAFEEDSDED